MPRQLLGTAIAANTITTTQLQTTVVNQISAGGGPRVSSLIYPGNDTAGNTVGGQTVYINGSGFETNNAIYINGNAVPSKSFISASNLSFTTPALSAGIYPVYVINTDNGATAIFIPGYISSAEPAWVTSAGSLSASQDELSAWSYSLSATGDAPITYALAAGSSLPGGISLAANGLISGTITSPSGNTTTYTFSVVATDAQNQDSTRQFTVTTSTGEGVLFANNVLLIHADGTNNGNNNQFLDSSNNNSSITRNGSLFQGSFSPFSQTGWSAYFDGTGDYLSIANNAALQMGSGNFTIEYWWYPNNITGYQTPYDKGYTNAGGLVLQTGNGDGRIIVYASGSAVVTSNTAVVPNSWTHMALVRNGTNLTLYQNGISVGSATNSTNFNDANTTGIGVNIVGSTQYPINGYLSNFRIVKGTALYTSGFTPPTTPLTAVANTSLLTLQSNRFIDNSTNAFTLTKNGDVSIQAFSPFAPTAAYSTANVGGSTYFDGSSTLNPSSTTAYADANQDFTVEFWIYRFTQGNHMMIGWPGNYYLWLHSSFIQLSTSTGYPAANYVPPVNTWEHIAISRNSNVIRIYANGKLADTPVSNSAATGQFGTTSGMVVGDWTGGNYKYTGYLSGFRFIRGTGLYPTEFTAPTSPPTNVANTTLLINFTNAQIVDYTAKNILQTVGDAKVSTAQYKYGTASIVFDGTGDGVLVKQANESLKFGSSNFTIEGWVYFNTVSARQVVFNQGWNTGSYASEGGFTLDMAGQTTAQLSLAIGTMNAGAFWLTTNASPAFTTGQWYHIALVRNGTTITIYRDGVSIGSSTLTSSTTKFANMGTFNLGIYDDGSLALNGYIDEVRVTKGYARYTSNFTAPSTAFKDK